MSWLRKRTPAGRWGRLEDLHGAVDLPGLRRLGFRQRPDAVRGRRHHRRHLSMTQIHPSPCRCVRSPPTWSRASRERFEVVRWFELDETAQRVAAGRARRGYPRGRDGRPRVAARVALMQTLPALRRHRHQRRRTRQGGPRRSRAKPRHRRGHTPGALAEDVADLAVGLIIALLRDIPPGDAYVSSRRMAGAASVPSVAR